MAINWDYETRCKDFEALFGSFCFYPCNASICCERYMLTIYCSGYSWVYGTGSPSRQDPDWYKELLFICVTTVKPLFPAILYPPYFSGNSNFCLFCLTLISEKVSLPIHKLGETVEQYSATKNQLTKGYCKPTALLQSVLTLFLPCSDKRRAVKNLKFNVKTETFTTEKNTNLRELLRTGKRESSSSDWLRV